MRAYIIRRVLVMIPTFILTTLIVFTIVRLIPGDVVEMMVRQLDLAPPTNIGGAGAGGVSNFSPQEYISMRLGLDAPVHIQYFRWVGGVLQGDFGWSIWENAPILPNMMARFPVSLELGFLGIVTAILFALPIGIYSAIRQDTVGDYAGRTIAVMAISMPSFWLATMVVVYPSIYFGWTPPLGYIALAHDPLGNLGQFIIPGFLMGMVMSGTTMRMTRTMMLEVLRQDYIRTAWSKGLRERTVIVRHALKNAFIPVVTIIGLMLPVLVGGSVVIETVFGLPGIGAYLLDAISRRDYPIISAINVVIAAVILINNLVIDLTYAWLDPRVVYR